jgi:cellulose synthase/poly-beta-1,6-N-acetylglucosamine synthase-like glycosyltransferase
MTPSQAEMMYSYCKSDSAVSRSRSLCKIKSNIVTTKPLDDWKSLFYQRVRWASRRLLMSAFGQVLGLVVLLGISVLLYGLWIMGLLSLLTICLLILLKFAIDAVLIHKSHSF